MAARRSATASSLKDAPSLEELAGQRPEFADVRRVWDGDLAPKLRAREAGRRQVVTRAIRKTVTGAIIAGVLILMTFVLGEDLGDFVRFLIIAGGVFGILAYSGLDWIRVYTMKSQTKDLVMGTASGMFGFRYQTLHPDLSDITDVKTLLSRSKEISETFSGKSAGNSVTISTPFGRWSAGKDTGPPPPTPAFEALKEAALLPSYDTRQFEDLIEGERAGAQFSLVEAKLETSGDNSSTVFQGILIHVEFPQRFLGRTVMARSGWWKRGKDADELKKVDLISRELNESFTVYSNDQVEARAILSPDRMERLIALERYFSGGKLRGVFDSGHMTLALEAPDQFEAGSIFEPLVDPRRFASALSELGLVCDLIDGFLTREWVKGRL